MTASTVLHAHCPFCDLQQVRSVSDIDDPKVVITIDGDNQTVEWELNCQACDFPVRGTTSWADATITTTSKE